MRHLFMIFLVASSFSVSGFCQTSDHQSWFNKKSEEQKNSKEEELLKIREELDGLNEKAKQAFQKMKKESEENRRREAQRREEIDRQMKEKEKESKKKDQEFREKWEEGKKQFQEMLEKREQQFENLKKRLRQEQEESEQIQEIIMSQCGIKPRDRYANISSQGQCFHCSSEDFFQDPQLLVFMSFSIPDLTWVSLSQELEKVGGTFILRGLPHQSFQALASRILKLKEQGVQAPIQLDPKRFLQFEITQVPAIVAVEERAFDKVSGHVSLKFALEKMAEHGETKIAKTLYQAFKAKI